MNRREFLVALASVGCGAKAVPRTSRQGTRDAGSVREDAAVTAIADDFQPQAQVHASPILAVGSLFARRLASELVFLDSATLKPVQTVTSAYGSMCSSGASSILALTHKPCEVQSFVGASAGAKMLVPGGCTSQDGAVLVAAGSSLYLSASGDTLAVYELARDQLAENGTIHLDDRTRDTFQMLGLADGRLLVPAGKELRIYRGAAAGEPLRAPSHIVHLASAGADRIWYSARNDGAIDRVVLAKLEPGLPEVATLEARVVHLASAVNGSGVAVLSVDATGWSIILLDGTGRERRRIHLPAELVQYGLASCFVALSATTVVLDARGHGVFGWSVATGARI